ncbi:transposase family protein [Meiothermus sp.]|uniref:transposase family protein n=1 Tax=Meiothermus sp. TaxID=1955249 RepID=UPI00307E3263
MKLNKPIPSPIPYLLQVPDLRVHNTTYDWRMLFMLVLMALGSGRTNILAIAQWMQDQRDWPLVMGFGRRKTRTALPAQATIYRFLWALEQQVVALEKALQHPGATRGRGTAGGQPGWQTPQGQRAGGWRG